MGLGRLLEALKALRHFRAVLTIRLPHKRIRRLLEPMNFKRFRVALRRESLFLLIPLFLVRNFSSPGVLRVRFSKKKFKCLELRLLTL